MLNLRKCEKYPPLAQAHTSRHGPRKPASNRPLNPTDHPPTIFHPPRMGSRPTRGDISPTHLDGPAEEGAAASI